jgi:hypothetical protein
MMIETMTAIFVSKQPTPKLTRKSAVPIHFLGYDPKASNEIAPSIPPISATELP